MNSKDIAKTNINLKIGNKILLENTEFKLAFGKKYGLLGPNGCGKTSLLKHIACRNIPLPDNLDIYCVEQEIEASEKSVFDYIIESNKVRLELLKKCEELEDIMEDESRTLDNFEEIVEQYNDVVNQLNMMDSDKDESIVRTILYGLGFSIEEQDYPTNNFSGGWRMRISLARALYLRPTVLLLDEPNNHLDLDAIIWLTDYLSDTWKRTLLLVSHDRNFINDICTDIINLENKKLCYYKGNYEKFKNKYNKECITKQKNWEKILKQVKKLKTKIEKKKYLEKNKEFEPVKQYRPKLEFLKPYHIDNALSNVEGATFGYSKDKILFENINLEINMGDRYVMVGANGVGKSTFMKIIYGDNIPLSGKVILDHRLRKSYYSQHAADVLPMELTPLEYIDGINKQFLEDYKDNPIIKESANISMQQIRKSLGTIGLDSKTHITKIKFLSGGQKARVLMASLFVTKPHLLLLDEPTNHLDIETIDALIDAINKFDGAILFITHNIDLITKTNSTLIELCNKKFNKISFEEYYDKVMEKYMEKY